MIVKSDSQNSVFLHRIFDLTKSPSLAQFTNDRRQQKILLKQKISAF